MGHCQSWTSLLLVSLCFFASAWRGINLFLDKALANVPKSKIRDQLVEVGFDDARQSDIVGGLSGGWKMKLELARAMLYNADLLLLDEVMFLDLST